MFGSLDGPNTIGASPRPEAETVLLPWGVDPADCALHMEMEFPSEAEASAVAARARASLAGAAVPGADGWFAADIVDATEAVIEARQTRQ